MRKFSLAIKFIQILLLFQHLALAQASLPTPFAYALSTNDAEFVHFSEKLMTYLGKIEIDATAQQNLTHTIEALRKQMSDERPFEIRYIQRSAFGRSFIRHQYELERSDQKLRCMLTYRRKTDGWRANQLWCS